MSGNAPGPREFELKLSVTEDQLKRLRTKQVLKNLGVGRARRRTLRSIYYDTADHSLHAQGASLRIRREGARWVQTFKSNQDLSAGLSRPIEIEQPVDGPVPDIGRLSNASLVGDANSILSKADISPVFETVVSRTTRELRTPDGSRIEVGFDRGTVNASNRTVLLSEVEIELKSGNPASVFRVARALCACEAIRFSGLSKAEQGYRVATGVCEQPTLPRRFSHPGVSGKATTREALVHLLRTLTEQIADNWGATLDSGDVEGPHQLRVSLRRLRSVLQVLRGFADRDRVRALEEEAKTLAATAGELRDADVLVEETVGDVAAALPNEPALDILAQNVDQWRKKIRQRIVAELSDDRVVLFLLRLGEFVEELDSHTGDRRFGRPAAHAAARELKKSWRKARKHSKRIEELSVAERHRLRKDLKRLRYQTEIFGTLFAGRKVKPFVKSLKELQDLLGYLNDVAAAERLRSVGVWRRADAVMAEYGAGLVRGWHEARAQNAWSRARDAWEAFAALKPFWA